MVCCCDASILAQVLYKGRLIELIVGGVRVKRRSPLSSLTELRSYGFVVKGFVGGGRLLVTMGREKSAAAADASSSNKTNSADGARKPEAAKTASGFFIYHQKRLLCPFFAVAAQVKWHGCASFLRCKLDCSQHM